MQTQRRSNRQAIGALAPACWQLQAVGTQHVAANCSRTHHLPGSRSSGTRLACRCQCCSRPAAGSACRQRSEGRPWAQRRASSNTSRRRKRQEKRRPLWCTNNDQQWRHLPPAARPIGCCAEAQRMHIKQVCPASLQRTGTQMAPVPGGHTLCSSLFTSYLLRPSGISLTNRVFLFK